MSNFWRYLIFFSIATFVLFGMHWVVYRQFRLAFGIPASAIWLKAVVVFLALSYIGSVSLGRWKPNGVTEFIVLCTSFWLGISVYLFLFGFAGDLLSGLFALVKFSRWTGIPWEEWRRFVAFSTLSISIFVSIWAISVAFGKFTIKQVEQRIERLDPSLDGMKVIVVSDLHLGAVHRDGFSRRITKAINELQPDLVVIPGDLADGDPYLLKEKIAPLSGIHAKYGVYWCTGNHEYYTGQGIVVAGMDSAGIPVLRNQAVSVANGKLYVAGVNDPTDKSMGGEGTRYDKALANLDPKIPVILMAHQPRLFRDAFKLGADIMVSGHTHGGQLWPFNYIVDRVWEVPRGAYREGNHLLYVSVGIGTWGPPMRLSQPPEIVEITLRRG